MTEQTNLDRFKKDPIKFIETVLCDPETVKPFMLTEAERFFLKLAFKLKPNGKLMYPELVFGAMKKSGKTTLAAIIMITMLLLFGGRFAEAYCLANDLEQAQSRVFAIIKRIIAGSPLLTREATITANKIVFPHFHDATIISLASDAASAAGGNPTISCFDELWGYTSERARRLFDEMVVSPARQTSCRLTVSYAGFSGESNLLEDLYKRGMALPEVGPSLRAGDGMLFAWHHEPISPWQDEAWLAQMRRDLRPNQFLRMIENRFVISEQTFIPPEDWDRCVVPTLRPQIANHVLPIWVGIDASYKHDTTAIVAVSYDQKSKQVVLVTHRVFQPSPDDSLNFEQTVEKTIIDLNNRFQIRQVLFDPYQMIGASQRLAAAGIKVEEFAQTQANMTAASQQLYDLIKDGNIVLYPDAAMRLGMTRTIAKETQRG
jgi:phage terminase large subunit-like protein